MIETLLKKQFPGYPTEYPPRAYRYNPASIRVRLVHDMFKGKSRSEREKMVLPVIRTLPEEIQQDLMVLLLLPPDELGRSAMNLEFEHPTPSGL
jgi:hypothetical protein